MSIPFVDRNPTKKEFELLLLAINIYQDEVLGKEAELHVSG